MTPTNIVGANQNMVAPYTQQWNLTIETQLPHEFVLSTAYGGFKSSKLFGSRNIDPALPAPGATTANAQARRRYPQFTFIEDEHTAGYSQYDSFQLLLKRRFGAGLGIQSAYTLSKNTGYTGSQGEGSRGTRDPLNWALDDGILGFDATHVWNTSYVWQLPSPVKRGLGRHVLGGWEFTGILHVQSGFPLTIRSGAGGSKNGQLLDTGDLVGDPALTSGSRGEEIRRWFNTDAFATSSGGTVGNVGINTMRGPGQWAFDMGFFKNIHVSERVVVQFRNEFFNLFNNANLAGPVATVTSGAFGQIFSTATGVEPRVIEFGLKFRFLRKAVGICFSLLLVLASVPLGAALEKPKVLFINVDDLNDWIGCLGGHPQAQTPTIDGLARDGVLFANTHCAAPLCNPSRIFRRNGYYTAAAGKIFHANHGGWRGALTHAEGAPFADRSGFGQPEAWDERFPEKTIQLPMAPMLIGTHRNGIRHHWNWGPIDFKADVTEDGQTSRWAVRQLRAEHDRPFFLAIGIYRPHNPQYAPSEYFEEHPLDSLELPTILPDDLDDIPRIAKRYLRSANNYEAMIRKRNTVRSATRGYLAAVTFADATLGRVLRALAASRYADNTIVVLFSDHGYHTCEKQKYPICSLWEDATRVPLIIVAPGVTNPGSMSTRAVSLVDLYPTLAELAGLEQPTNLDGASLLSLLRNPDAPRTSPALTTHQGRHHALRTDRWRYIRYVDGSEELYDHDADRMEWKNLAGDPTYEATKQQLAVALDRMLR